MTIGELVSVLTAFEANRTVVLGVRQRHGERYYLADSEPQQGILPWPGRAPRDEVRPLTVVVLPCTDDNEVIVDIVADK